MACSSSKVHSWLISGLWSAGTSHFGYCSGFTCMCMIKTGVLWGTLGDSTKSGGLVLQVAAAPAPVQLGSCTMHCA